MPALRMYRGDHARVEVTVDTEAADIDGSTIWMTAKRKVTDSDADAVFQKFSPNDGVIIDGEAKTAVVVIEPEDTSSLTKETKLQYDIQFKDIDGTVSTISTGVLTVLMDVTNTTD